MLTYAIYLDQIKTVAEIVQALGIGFGALAGGLGALKVLSEWYEKKKSKRLKRKWLKFYPKAKLNEDFRLLYHSFTAEGGDIIGRSDHIYICDERTNSKHWIANSETLKILGFNGDEAEGVTKKELERYKMAEHIDLTR